LLPVKALVAEVLEGTGMELVGAFPASEWDARAPRPELRCEALLPEARGAIVVGSAGPSLFRAFREQADPSLEHPLDAFVGTILDRVDAAFAQANVRARRFEPTVVATPRIDFRTLAELAGLGTMGPFGMLIHPVHGPWWALRGAWLVDREVESPEKPSSPCVGCARPCLAGADPTTIGFATAEMRLRCPIGVASRYDDDAIAYHHLGVRPSFLGR
jgi:epoxyqueuosine reductase QueG